RRADNERRRADSEGQRAEDVTAQCRQTTLAEHITNCHDYLDLNITVKPNNSLPSKGTITNPQDKLVSSTLKPWTDFLEQQKSIHGRLYSTFPADKQAFESVTFLEELGERLRRKKIANERDLESVQHNILQTPVTNIVEILKDQDATKRTFALGRGLTFDNHPNALSEMALTNQHNDVRYPIRTSFAPTGCASTGTMAWTGAGETWLSWLIASRRIS
ncbi:uncharacterized protein B0I36DRAFT_43376, partial [Microdochium trichocladiopsis]